MVNTYLVLFIFRFFGFADAPWRVPTSSFMFTGRCMQRPYWVVIVLLFIFVGTRHDASVIVLVSVYADASCCVPTSFFMFLRTHHGASLLGYVYADAMRCVPTYYSNKS